MNISPAASETASRSGVQSSGVDERRAVLGGQLVEVERFTSRHWTLERQVRFSAGSLVVLGTVLGTLISPWWLLLSGFVGGGLAFSGATNTCGMALVPARMPWNR